MLYSNPNLSPFPVIEIPRKLFIFLVVGLVSLAVASLCAMLDLAMSQAVVLFLVTWIGMIVILEALTAPTHSSSSQNFRDPPRGP